MPPRYHGALSKLDMYRKVPTELMEGTKRGSLLSYMALLSMAALFVLETYAFLQSKTLTQLALDRSEDARLRINFNITMLDLPCEWAVVDVVSAYGTDQNVTAHVSKWQLDSTGVKKIYRGRNRNQRDVQIDLWDSTVQSSLEEMHVNGEDAVALNEETLEYALAENEYVFVDFYASWCSHCRDLAPTWEALAELMMDASEKLLASGRLDHYEKQDLEAAVKLKLPVMIGKVDCVLHPQLCNVQENIRAYPTLRLFVDGEKWKGGDYKGHRTLLEMVEWLFHIEEEHKDHMDEHERQLHVAHQAARQRLLDGEESDEERKWHDKIMRDKKRLHYRWREEEHPGCQLSGHLVVDRTPGNFHIQARSSNQEFAAHMTNVSHMVHSLTIGDPMAKYILVDKFQNNQIKPHKVANVPTNVVSKINPLAGNVYVNLDLHESYHHYLKLVATQVQGLQVGTRPLKVFQIMENSQLSYYNEYTVPEAKFAYDLSPIKVTYETRSRQWYEYVTSIMAIVGGVFTVVGMLESSIQATISKVQQRRQGGSASSAATAHRHRL